MQSPENPTRVVLTGGGGFIGRPCLERLLECGYEVWATSSSRPSSDQDQLHWRQVDLLDCGARRSLLDEVRPSHLLHLAWHSGDDIYRSVENYRWLAASLELLCEFAERGGRRMVFTGSCAEYQWGDEPCSEGTTVLEPRSAYGRAKKALGEAFEGFVADHEPALSGAWARLFFLYGPHEKPPRLVPSVVEALLNGQPARCSHGRQRRDYLSSLDAAEALVKLLDSDLRGPINVASGEAPEVRQLVLAVARLLGREQLIKLGALSVPVDDPPRIVADVSRLRDELGWQPRLSLDQGLRQTVEWWRAQSAEHQELP